MLGKRKAFSCKFSGKIFWESVAEWLLLVVVEAVGSTFST